MHLSRHGAYVVGLALCAVSPLLVPEVSSGFRLAQSDPVLSVISAAEQPLSVRSPAGVWAVALTLVWWTLAYRRRELAVWETLLVLLGGIAVLSRLGNAWVDALAMVVPLARQIARLNPRPLPLAVAAGACLIVGLLILSHTRPPDLPADASRAIAAAPDRGAILVDWRWAGDLQRRLGLSRQVLGAGGLASESPAFWLAYLRIAQGHERWADALREMNVDLVVLDASDQQRQAAALVRGSTDWQVLYDANGALIAERISQ